MEMLSIQGLKISPSTNSPTPAAAAPTRARAAFLDQPNRDCSASAGLSSRLIREVMPANSTAIKNSTANSCPKGRLRITEGMVMNKSPGPELGSMP